MVRYCLFLFLCTNLSLWAQDCPKAWMHWEERKALQQHILEREGYELPMAKIHIDFLGAPVGLPYNYALHHTVPPEEVVTFELEEDTFHLHHRAYQSWQQLTAAADSAGIPLKLKQAYRSYSEQKRLYQRLGPKRAERPGYSEHHLYTCVDIRYVSKDSRSFCWLLEHAFVAGWVPSYYFRVNCSTEPEPWHWRYVGPLAAEKFRCAWRVEIDQL